MTIQPENRLIVPFECEICHKEHMAGWKMSYEIEVIGRPGITTRVLFICKKCAPTEAHFTDPDLLKSMLSG